MRERGTHRHLTANRTIRSLLNNPNCQLESLLDPIQQQLILLEIVFLNPGAPEHADDKNTWHGDVLRLPDTLFDKSIDVMEKQTILKDNFGIPMTKEVIDNMETMSELRFGFEAEAEARGERRGERKIYYELVHKGMLTAEFAAGELGMTVPNFKARMERFFWKQQNEGARDS